MFRVLSCLTVEHDLWLVALAGIVCFLASLAAINLFHRAIATKGRAKAIWLGTAGAASGCGIWATHFIAVLAYSPGVSVNYNVGLTVFSLIVAAAVTGAGLSVAAYNRSRWRSWLGGALVGAGVACMHYSGMSALEMPGHIVWSGDLVAASLLVGMLFGAASLWAAVHRTSKSATLAAGILLTLAIVSHHFTAMGAVEIVPDPTRAIAVLSLSPTWMAIGIANAAVAILAMSLAGAFVDKRAAERIAHMAHHDPLTGLPNRAAFTTQFATVLERSAAAGCGSPSCALISTGSRRSTISSAMRPVTAFCAKSRTGSLQRSKASSLHASEVMSSQSSCRESSSRLSQPPWLRACSLRCPRISKSRPKASLLA